MRNRSLILVIIRMLLIGVLTLTSCQSQLAAEPPAPTIDTPTVAPLQPTQTIETIPPTSTATATHTATASPTPPPPTPTPSLTPTPTWVDYEPGQVVAPILLYHHVDGENTNSRYRVSIPDFQAQMGWLSEQDYTVITISTLVEVLLNGGALPEKSIVITFDDGHLSVYEHAFPIMDELGFPGVFYIVANRIYNAPDFVNIEQITALVNAGWEIGSHGYTHLDVTKNHASAHYEIGQSKADLQAALGVPIQTFAYPFGEVDPFSAQVVSDSSYRAGMGLGQSTTHTWGNLFYLHRIEIHGTDTLEMFIARLNPD